MTTSETAQERFQIDWLLSNLRWLLVVSVALVSLVHAFTGDDTVLDPASFLPHVALLTIAALYNLGVMLLLSYGTPSRLTPKLTLLVDTVLTLGFVITSGGLASPLLFFALFPIITAALRFRWTVSVLVALTVVVGSGIAGYFIDPTAESWADLLPFVIPSLVLLLATLISGLVGDKVRQIIERTRRLEETTELRKLRAAHEHSRAMFELASTLSATLNYDKVLEAVLEVGEAGIRDLGPPEATQVSMVMLLIHDDLHVVASRHLPPPDRRAVLQAKSGVLAEALPNAEAVIVDNPAADPELGQLVVMHGCRQAIVVPLRAGFETFGAVIFGSRQPTTYTEEHRDLAIAICNQAIVALQNAQLYQSLTDEKERIVAVEENARKKLARGLHDGPTQSIASIAMRLHYTRTLVDGDPQHMTAELKQIEELARHTTKEIRHMLFTLRPLILETQGLQAALGQYISKLAEMDTIPIHLDAAPKVDQSLGQDAQGVIFYVLEEAIGNARKHAQAENIWVRLHLQDGNLFVAEVEDDGRGFDVRQVKVGYEERGSLGLVNMHERAQLVGSNLTIASAPGRGTRVKLTLPLPEG